MTWHKDLRREVLEQFVERQASVIERGLRDYGEHHEASRDKTPSPEGPCKCGHRAIRHNRRGCWAQLLGRDRCECLAYEPRSG